MSLYRQLLSLFLGSMCLASFLAAFFLGIQMVLIVPSQHPALAATMEPAAASATLPQELLLPGRETAIPIIPNSLQTGEWILPTNGVSLLQQSETASQLGYIMYGHNWPALLGSLSQAQLGETIRLRFANQEEKIYVIQTKFIVSPQRVDVLHMATQPDSLLIYTCTGLFDRNRLVVVAQEVMSD